MKSNRWIAPALLALALPVTAYAQTRTTTINTQTLATTQLAGTPYVLSSGFNTQIYTISPDTFTRVQLPAGDSTIPLSSIAMKLGTTSTPILVGTFTNLSAINFGFSSTTTTRYPVSGTVTTVKCDGQICSCTGKTDCRDMGNARLCVGGANTNWWSCDSKSCVCLDKEGTGAAAE